VVAAQKVSDINPLLVRSDVISLSLRRLPDHAV